VAVFFDVMIATDADAADAEVPFWQGSACGESSLPESLKVGKKAATAVDEIETRMQSDRTTPLSAAAIEVISRNKIPVYKILNLFSIRNRLTGTKFLSDDEKDMIVKVTAIGHAAYLLESGIRKSYQLMTTVVHELLPVFTKVQGHDQDFIESKNAFDKKVIMVQNELHQREDTEMLKYKDNINTLMNILTVQRGLEEAVFAPMYSLR
jgi:hypothetical protein